MKITLNLDFSVPIWKFFFDPNIKKLPYSFEYNNIIYENGITIIHIACYCVNNNYYINSLKENIIFYQNPILCAPDMETLHYLNNINFNCNCQIILASHNSFLDENIFTINKNIEKKYDLIVLSCFDKYKNVKFTENINNILHIGYFTLSTDTIYIPKNGYCPNFENNSRTIENFKLVSNENIVKYIQESKVGGIFSYEEGSCFSSGQYLLCGIPVISTYCKGGRQYWYNENNGIMCKDDNSSIEYSLKKALEKLNNKSFDSEKIRQMHLDEMDIQRNNLTNAVMNIFNLIVYENKRPDYNLLKDYLKYYSSSVRLGESFGIKQQKEELIAIDVINKFK